MFPNRLGMVAWPLRVIADSIASPLLFQCVIPFWVLGGNSCGRTTRGSLAQKANVGDAQGKNPERDSAHLSTFYDMLSLTRIGALKVALIRVRFLLDKCDLQSHSKNEEILDH
jgi:hypothetical protein